MADIYAPFVKKVFDIVQGPRKSDVHCKPSWMISGEVLK
jgi:hypothetical protein